MKQLADSLMKVRDQNFDKIKFLKITKNQWNLCPSKEYPTAHHIAMVTDEHCYGYSFEPFH